MKIIVLRGLPGSGKTTKAQELLQTYPNTVRLNKDSLREMTYFHGKNSKNFDHDIERAIGRVEYKMAKVFVQMGFNVIVDDTNLKQKYLNKYQELAKELECGFEVITLDTPIEECIRRDALRLDSVGETVIRDLARLL